MQYGYAENRKTKSLSQDGFTLIELLVIIIIVGILTALLVPSWLRFLTAYRVTAGKDRVRLGIQQAQMKSQQESISWQLSVRENAGIVEMATHPAAALPSSAVWEPLNNHVLLDEETNFATDDDIYYVQFDEKGNVRYRLGRMTLSSKNFPDIKRCVIVSTLIGNTRTAEENAIPKNGKYCY